MDPATDLGYLIQRGFDENEARLALAQAHGNVDNAVKILITNSQIDDAWSSETGDDWKNNINTSNLPRTAANRALWKSPFYLSVPSFRHVMINEKEHIVYTVNVIIKDGRNWKLTKRFSDFQKFYNSIPNQFLKNLH